MQMYFFSKRRHENIQNKYLVQSFKFLNTIEQCSIFERLLALYKRITQKGDTFG